MEILIEAIFIVIVFLAAAGFMVWAVSEGVNDTKMHHYVGGDEGAIGVGHGTSGEAVE